MARPNPTDCYKTFTIKIEDGKSVARQGRLRVAAAHRTDVLVTEQHASVFDAGLSCVACWHDRTRTPSHSKIASPQSRSDFHDGLIHTERRVVDHVRFQVTEVQKGTVKFLQYLVAVTFCFVTFAGT
jgi:hypothetical protein